jgi:signal transduction histidine kinase
MEEDRERRDLLDRLEAALEENAGLHAQLLTQAREAGVLDERQRIAREIHDTLAQGLTGIITQLEAAERGAGRPEQWRRHLDQAQALARDSLGEARRSVQALRPEPLEEATLPDALDELARRWSQTEAVELSFATTGEPRPLLAEVEATLFRVAQEALTNVAKHAGASKVGLTLSYTDQAVLLDVRDDGVGFAPRRRDGNGRRDGHGFGLDGMRQRLRRVAGSLAVESAPGDGTAVSASVPAIPVEGGR